MFTSNFPFDVATRVWDVFLAEGWTAVYRVAVALHSLAQGTPPLSLVYSALTPHSFFIDPCCVVAEDLRQADLEGALHHFRHFPQRVDPDRLIQEAMRFPVRRRDIQPALGEDAGDADGTQLSTDAAT